MKTLLCLIPVAMLAIPRVAAQTATYTNYIRQYQTPSNVIWDCSEAVASSGTQASALAINPGGARFDLWTIKNSPYTEYLLNTCYVGTYVPLATVVIRSEDPYPTIRRTRADRPFYVDVSVEGLLLGAADPEAAKKVKLLRHVQSYGVGGTGVEIDRTQAILLSPQVEITTTGMQTLTYELNSVPGADRSKVRGEERFSVFSIADIRPPTYNVPEIQISSQFIQIWPVADGSITGIATGQLIRYAMPQVTLTYNDLYPSSTTYAQVYKGNPQLGVTGTIVPGSQLVVNDSVPQNKTLTLKDTDYSSVFDADGRWTMELLTSTPFGIDRLAYVFFDLDRTMKVNGTFTTIEK